MWWYVLHGIATDKARLAYQVPINTSRWVVVATRPGGKSSVRAEEAFLVQS